MNNLVVQPLPHYQQYCKQRRSTHRFDASFSVCCPTTDRSACQEAARGGLVVVSHAVCCHILANVLVSRHFGCVYKGIEVRTVCPRTGYVFSMSHRQCTDIRVRLKPDGTRRRRGGEVKGILANGVGSQYSHTTSERGVSSITNADAHISAASSRLN